jgi:hypothetical protein
MSVRQQERKSFQSGRTQKVKIKVLPYLNNILSLFLALRGLLLAGWPSSAA